MEVKGDLKVRRTLIADRRADQGLLVQTLAGNYTAVRHDYHWLSFDAGGADRNVTLPDATTLPLGWRIVVHNTGVANLLNVKDNSGGLLQAVGQTPNYSGALEFILYGNGSAAGQWYIVDMSDNDNQTVIAGKFIATFLVADWPAGSGGYQELTSAQVAGLGAAAHTRGTTPVYIVQEKIGAVYDRTLCDRERMNASGDLALRIADMGIAFDGRVIFV